GVVVKLAGKVIPDPNTGRIVSIFDHTPDVPFEEFQLKFFTGPRASVATPAVCGIHRTETSMTPWSTGEPVPRPSSLFEIASACSPSTPLPFSPSFEAGVENTNAAAFSPLAVTIHHPDGHQPLQGLTVHLPKGVVAQLS